jgi:hypothetical protein
MRPNDWCERLDAYLHGILRKPFDKVEYNCGHFIVGAISAVSGKSVSEVLVGASITMPGTELGVVRVLHERGDMKGIARDYFGCEPETAMLLARRGDVALIRGDDGDALGVVDAAGVVAISPTGLVTFKLSDSLGFWKVE